MVLACDEAPGPGLPSWGSLRRTYVHVGLSWQLAVDCQGDERSPIGSRLNFYEEDIFVKLRMAEHMAWMLASGIWPIMSWSGPAMMAVGPRVRRV